MAVQKPSHISSKIWASQGTVEVPEDNKINSGWTLEVPKFQVENWVQNRSDQFAGHVNERGIPEWDATTDYLGGKSYVQGSDGKVYLAKVNSGPSSSVQNPVTDTSKTKWDEAFESKGNVVFKTGENGAAILPVGTTAQRPTPSEGLLRLNSDTGQMEGYQAGRWGDINITSKELFSGDSLTTEFQLSSSPESKDFLQVYISGVYQQKNTYELGGLSGDLLIFQEPPPTGTDNIEVVVSSLIPSDDRLRAELAAVDGASLVGFSGRSVAERLLDVVSVKDYGAKGDGVTDDTAAINSAILAAKVVFLPAGTYKTTATISQSQSNSVIYGDGIGASIIRAGDWVGLRLTNCDNATVRGVTVDNGASAWPSTNNNHAILLEGCTNSTVEFTEGRGSLATGIQVTGGGNNTVQFCRTTENAVSGIDHNLSPGTSTLFNRSYNDGRATTGQFSSISINSDHALTMGNIADGNLSGGQGLNFGHAGYRAGYGVAMGNMVRNITGRGYRLSSMEGTAVLANVAHTVSTDAYTSVSYTTAEGTATGLQDCLFAFNQGWSFSNRLIDANSTSRNIIAFNRGDGGTGNMYNLGGISDTILQSNIARSSGGTSMKVDNGSRLSVSGNLVLSGGMRGLDLTNTVDSTGYGNVAYANAEIGIRVTGLTGTLMANVARSNTTADISGGIAKENRRGQNWSGNSVTVNDVVSLGNAYLRFSDAAARLEFSTDGTVWSKLAVQP